VIRSTRGAKHRSGLAPSPGVRIGRHPRLSKRCGCRALRFYGQRRHCATRCGKRLQNCHDGATMSSIFGYKQAAGEKNPSGENRTRKNTSRSCVRRNATHARPIKGSARNLFYPRTLRLDRRWGRDRAGGGGGCRGDRICTCTSGQSEISPKSRRLGPRDKAIMATLCLGRADIAQIGRWHQTRCTQHSSRRTGAASIIMEIRRGNVYQPRDKLDHRMLSGWEQANGIAADRARRCRQIAAPRADAAVQQRT